MRATQRAHPERFQTMANKKQANNRRSLEKMPTLY